MNKPYGAGLSLSSDEHPAHNDDNYLVSFEEETYAAFDGLGGNPGSEVAADIALHTVYEHFLEQENVGISERVAFASIKCVLKRAHIAIAEKAIADNTDIATTAAVLRFFINEEGARKAVIGHSGDSRIYLQRQGWDLAMLTLDHTPHRNPDVAWADQKALSSAKSLDALNPSQRPLFRNRNKISAALGGCTTSEYVRSDVRCVDVQPGDRFAITTDGVHDNLTTEIIEQIMRESYDPATCANQLVGIAHIVSTKGTFRSKPDDISAVVVNVPA